jgi:hypothetical protein
MKKRMLHGLLLGLIFAVFVGMARFLVRSTSDKTPGSLSSGVESSESNSLLQNQSSTVTNHFVKQSKRLISNTPPPTLPLMPSAMTMDDWNTFQAYFHSHLRPAILNWYESYGERSPFDGYTVTVSNFLHRVSAPGKTHGQFMFYVDGVTLGVGHYEKESAGRPRVVYVASKKSRALSVIPEQVPKPILILPITRPDIAALAEADLGEVFTPDEIMIYPSGLSGSVNGGAIVEVGGDGYNALTTRLSLVFGPDGKLIYYHKGLDSMSLKKSAASVPNSPNSAGK